MTVRAGPLSNYNRGFVAPIRNATMIFAQGESGATWEGTISENYIYCPQQMTTGFGDAGWDGIEVKDNEIYGCSLFTFDTFDSTNVLFQNNILHTGTPAGGYCGIVGGGYRWKNWKIVGNQFYLQSSDGSWACY